MMKRVMAWLVMFSFLVALIGCGMEETVNGNTEIQEGSGTTEETVPPEEIVLTGEYAPVAEFASFPFISMRSSKFFYRGDEIFCMGKNADEILAFPADEAGESRVAAETDSAEGFYIHDFFVDEEGSLYLLEIGGRSPEYGWYLRKTDKNGKETYRVNVSGELENKGLAWVYVNGEGDLVLYVPENQDLYFYDSAGIWRGKDTVADTAVYNKYGIELHTPVFHDGGNDLVRIGGQYFLWRVNEEDETKESETISLWKVDFENCHISEEQVIDMVNFGGGKYKNRRGTRTFMLFDGGELGLLVSTEDILWQYDMETGVSEELLQWDYRTVNIDGRYVRQINVDGAGKDSFEVVSYSDNRDSYAYGIPEVARIAYIDKAYIKESQVVRIGLSNTSGGIEQAIRRFNRLNNGYEVVVADNYDAAMLKDMLSYGKEIPDLFDITDIRIDWLESKDLVEDLIPYFEKSKVIGREDILPAVWDLLGGNGEELTGMATGFTIRALTTASDLPEDGWTYEQLLSLKGQYPESWYMHPYTPTWMWSLISMTGINEFVDWEKRKCSFDSREFRDLIEGVKNLDYPVNQKTGNADDMLGMVMEKQVLMQFSNYGAPYDYEKEQEESGGGLKVISFPTMDGEPVYIFSASQSLAIYGESPNKEGAWAFLEFLLAEEQQRWYGGDRDMFPVNAKAFEGYLDRHHNVYGSGESAMEETKEKLRYMASHLALNQNAADEIRDIIVEELKAYFAGDKTTRKTAKTIQNRVQLYLDEM